MTTAFNIDELIDKPYTELTADELNAVIDYKADIKARDKVHQESLDILNQTTEKLIKQQEELADKSINEQDELLKLSLARLQKLVDGA